MTVYTVERPIISPEEHPSVGRNIQGPALVEVPDWVPNRLGRYYLYFADHKGDHIRLAWAEALTGPWHIYEPGALRLADSHFPTAPQHGTDAEVATMRERLLAAGIVMDGLEHSLAEEFSTPHIASPDVLIDAEQRRFILYYHGLERFGVQRTRVATSSDGLNFTAEAPLLGLTYWRGFAWNGACYALTMPGQFYRSDSWLGPFERGPRLFDGNMRHAAVRVAEDQLEVFWTQVGDTPERIYRCEIDLRPDWAAWRTSERVEVLRPERSWEGADLPLQPSVRSFAPRPVNQLRDPALIEINVGADAGLYLAYAVAGESGIGIARLHRN